MTKEDYNQQLERLNKTIKAVEDSKLAVRDQYIFSNAPAQIDQEVSITLKGGRKAKGKVKTLGILANQTVCITSYEDLNDVNKTKYITVPHLEVTPI